MQRLLGMLRAAGDLTRLRLILLLAKAELTVSEITEIMGQSQPRVSRHLKLLCDAGLLERVKEGAWVFYRGADNPEAAELIRGFDRLSGDNSDPVLRADQQRLIQVRAERGRQASEYFAANAAQWETIRALHVPEIEVEHAIVRLLRGARLEQVLDVGTGTGRILEVLALYVRRGIGIDSSPEMLAIARDRLAHAGIVNCQIRRGDLYRLPFADSSWGEGFDAIIFHQVLHFLDDPQAAIREAKRVLRPGGRLLVADFAPHQLEFLRNDYAHRRLGFSDADVEAWFRSAGLQSVTTESFAPPTGAGALSVVIWLGEYAVAGQRRKTGTAA